MERLEETDPIKQLSQKETAILNEFRKYVDSLDLFHKLDDYYILRFLIARKFDLNKTIEMFTKFLEFREEYEVDVIDNFDFPELEEVRKCYPHGFFNITKDGRPLYIERWGKLQVKKLFEVTTKERLTLHAIHDNERLIKHILPACSRYAGKKITKSFVIIDLKGISAWDLWVEISGFFKNIATIEQNYYPELLGNMYIVNAPMFYSVVWNLIKNLIDKKTQDKIKILSSDYQSELLKHVDEKNLPDFLGGKATIEEYGEYFEKETGPWLDPELVIESENDEMRAARISKLL